MAGDNLKKPSDAKAVAREVNSARKRRRWVFRLGAAILGPAFLLVVAELGLRVGGYGYSTSFFKPFQIGGKDCFVENDKFGWRYFPPELARSPAPVRFLAQKPTGLCRIFVLGESAALGDPRPAYGAGRYLQALLEERFPGKRFEVVCVAMTAINSHAVLDIAGECARHQGDFWIIYMGNNEMVGPFGAASVFGPQAPSRWLVRLSLALQETRVGQLLRAWGRHFRNPPAQSWAGMEMFTKNRVPPGSSAKTQVYRNFRANLDGIIKAGLGAGARVILSTVAVNLRDSPPFASVAGPRLSNEDRAACDNLLKASVAALQETNYEQAAQSFAQAASLDPDRADIEFYLAACLLRLTNVVAARQHYQRACDLDALPFRADSTINNTLAEAGRKYAGSDLVFFDAIRTMAQSSPVGIPGVESFYEHVHFNFDGNYRLGRAWAEQIAGFLEQGADKMDSAAHASSPAAQTAGATNSLDGAVLPTPSLLSTPKDTLKLSEWASQSVCERRLGLTDWNRAAVFEDMLRRFSQPPLSTQPNNNSRWEALHKQLNEIRQRLDASAATNARQVYLEALQRAPEDERLHENFAEFLEDTGQLSEAEAQWEQVRELIPQHHLGYFESGRLLLRLAKLPEARARLNQAVELRPDLGEGWLELGNIDSLEGKPEHALTEYKRAQQLTPQDPRPYYHMGKALSKLGKPVQAVQQLRLAVKAQPAFWEAHYALGEELAFMGMVEAARGEFEQTLRLKPDYAMAHLNLGVALLQDGKIEPAVKELHEAQRLDPKNPLAGEYLKKIQGQAPKEGSGGVK